MHANHRRLLPALTGFLALATAWAAPVPPVVRVPTCELPPRVDGMLDDACWSMAYVSPTFHDFALKDTAYRPNADTTLRLVADSSWLYVGLECRHPKPSDMKATITENYGGRVFGDECVKFFISPGLEGTQHVRYVLNCRNVFTLRRSFNEASSVPNVAWPSATRVTDDGWVAEIAVPLFHLAGYGELSKFRLHVFRKKVLKEYDEHHVEVGFHEFISTWAPTDEWLNVSEMGRLEGLGNPRVTAPFVANIGDVSLGALYEQAGGVCYDVNMTLMAMTDKPGTAAIDVLETPLDGEPRRVRQTFALEPKQVTQATVTVPVEALGQRTVNVVVRDVATECPFQTVQLKDTSAFRMLTALTGRNYYTNEPAAEVTVTVGMPVEALAKLRLVIRAADGTELARRDAPAPRGELSLPLGAMKRGQHTLVLTLEGLDGRKISQVDFELVKLSPKPGCEWKVDRQTGALLENGNPFFPIGFLAGYDDSQYREIAEAGFNTVVWWMGPDSVPMAEVIALAAKYDLRIIVRPQKIPSRAAEMETLKRHFQDEQEYKQALYGCRAMLRLKAFLLGRLAGRLTRAQRNEISREFFDLHLPAICDNVRSIQDMPNLIGYDTLDEPVFDTADQDVDLRRMYLKIKETDPYRPMYALYSSRIPAGPKATSFGDCLGTDPYWTPGRSLPRGSVNWMSQTTARTVARAREVGQHPWTVPQASLWSDVIKRMLTGDEQICQSYLALIHGTKSLLWFTHGWVATQKQWEALKTVATHVNRLTPALTAPEPPQQISYKPGKWNPLEGDLPDVQARLIRFPNGPWVLLAANVRRSGVGLSVHVKGLRDKQARGLFTGPLGPIAGGAFGDTLDARGVRAYVFDHIKTDGPVQIAMNIAALGEEGPIEDGYRHEGRAGMKNITPNPSFEQAAVAGFPDYCWPYHSRDGRTGWRHRVGTPDACLILGTDTPYHGERFLRLHPREPDVSVGIFLRSVAPQHSAPQPYVFSFYARTHATEPVTIHTKTYGRNRPDVVVKGSEWTRFSVPLDVPAHADSHSWLLIRATGQVDLDALQFEKGREPTEFQP
ncbi:MAG: hypothetical protein HN742_41665 [Lentisphaerae bacterium]|jgi:hypothetical protein|nr:hypothetical protein [Lentisphaerota bacterium]MBT4816955.1 hypothetical protein [Lentisphaerota bacterium]MBT5611717.1 hypothetical protein [Lentisphaerota bacterium]MBT7060443.1 hypothetical protein [Lentisphaerota bacterium]MBT7848446.1 hypothetical protein [Lentisphaerota bacterium]